MKLLQEFIALFESKINDNLKIMAKLSGDTYRYEARHPSEEDTFWSDYFLDPSLDKKLFRDISRSTQLHARDVVALLGAGSEGIAFELDDGSVLKLGGMHRGISPGKYYLTSNPWKYKQKIPTRTQNDIRISDVGRAHVNMEKLIPFREFLKKLPDNEKIALDAGAFTFFDLVSKLRKNGDHVDDIRAAILSAVKDIRSGDNKYIKPDQFSADGLKWLIGIAKAYMNEADNASIDLSSHNLGVRPGTEPVFVFYDF